MFSLASKLGYRYLDDRTRPAKSNRTRNLNIGVIICGSEEIWHTEKYEVPGELLLAGLSEYAQIHSHRIDCRYAISEPENLSALSGRLDSIIPYKAWDGVLLIYPFPSHWLDEIFAAKPSVSLVEQYGSTEIDCVDVDHYHGVSKLVDLLIEYGHRRIGFVTHEYQPQARWSLRRYSAFIEKSMSLGMPVDTSDYFTYDPLKPKAQGRFIKSIIKGIKGGISALICASDQDAFDLIVNLKKEGVEVPRDVSIVGFDGLATPAGLPDLTTIQIPRWEIGRMAFMRLEDRIQRLDTPSSHILLGGELKIGESVSFHRAEDASKRRRQ